MSVLTIFEQLRCDGCSVAGAKGAYAKDTF